MKGAENPPFMLDFNQVDLSEKLGGERGNLANFARIGAYACKLPQE